MRITVTAPLAAGAAALVLLAGCGTTEEPTAAAAEPSGAARGPVSVTDSRGKEVTLDQPAERVVVLEWGEAEMVTSLGVTPVGVADTKGYATWDAAVPLDASVKDVGTRGEPSIDSIMGLDPDLVIAIADITPAVLTQLEGKVPVLVSKGTDASRNMERLREEFTAIGTLLGREVAAKEVLADMDQSLAEGKDAIAKAGATGTPFVMADGWKEGSSVSIRPFGKGSLVSDVAEELGLVNAWSGKVDAAWGLGQTDLEGMTAVKDPRTHLFYSASEDDVFAGDLAKNAIWSGLPFAAEGRLHKLDPGTWTFGGPKSVEKVANQFVRGITG
jgi:ferric hydroxamate transport system substrate-binding protein